MKNITKILDDYSSLQAKIYDYFDLDEDSVTLPIVYHKDMFWTIINHETYSSVKYASKKEDVQNATGNYFDDEIYLPGVNGKWGCRGSECTMIIVQTENPSVISMYIFDTAKEIRQ